MEEKTNLFEILKSDIALSTEQVKESRTILTGIVATGLGALFTLLILFKDNSIIVSSNPIEYIPFYASISAISYGFYILFLWYDVNIYGKRLLGGEKITTQYPMYYMNKMAEPNRLLMSVFQITGIVTVAISIIMLIQKFNLLIWIFVILLMFILLKLLISISRDVRHKGRKIEPGTKSNFLMDFFTNKYIKNKYYYSGIILLLVIGFIILFYYPSDYKIGMIIVSIYLVEIPLLLINCLGHYRNLVFHKFITRYLVSLREELINNRIPEERIWDMRERIFNPTLSEIPK